MRHAAIKARNPEKTSGLYLDIYLVKSTDLPNPLINLINLLIYLPSTDLSTSTSTDLLSTTTTSDLTY